MFRLAIKLLISIRCIILPVAEFRLQKMYISMKLSNIIKKYLKSQSFADDKWHEKDNELFFDFTYILDINMPILDIDIIPCWNLFLHLNLLGNLSRFSDISDKVGDEEHNKKYNATSENRLREETEEEPDWQFNKEDGNYDI